MIRNQVIGRIAVAAMVAFGMLGATNSRAQTCTSSAFALLVDQSSFTVAACQDATATVSATASCPLSSETQINLSATVTPATGLTVNLGGSMLPTFTAYNTVRFTGTVAGTYTVTVTGTGTGSRAGQTSSVDVTVNVTSSSASCGFPGPDQACPCAAATNHGAYVSCIAHWVKAARDAGVGTEAQRQQVLTDAAHSSCGK